MEESDKKLNEILKRNNKLYCDCGRKIDRGDVMWNNGCTSVGTPFATLEIICQKCGEEILEVRTWWDVEDFNDFVEALEEYEEKI